MKPEETILKHIAKHELKMKTAIKDKDIILVGMMEVAIHELRWVLEDG